MHKLPVIVILTALSEEYAAVREHLCQISDDDQDDTNYERGIFKFNNEDVAQIIIRECGQKNAAAAQETERAIHIFSPDALFFVGIAGSRKPTDFKVGDVIVAEKIYSYEGGKSEKNAFRARPDIATASYSVVEKTKAARRKEDWKELIRLQIDKTDIKANIGIIASGDNLIEHYESEIGKIITDHYNDTHAVEMEGFGFAKAASRQGRGKSSCLFGVIRGISDILKNETYNSVTSEKECSSDRRPEKVKQLASGTAAAFTFFLIFKLFENKEKEPKIESSSLNSGTGYSAQQPSNKFVTLPAPIANLPIIIGREKEIEDLKLRLLEQGSPIAVTGIRGIGKTSIVRAAVSQLINSFEHIGWTSLHGSDVNFDEFFASQILVNNSESFPNSASGTLSFSKAVASLVDLKGKKLFVIENVKPAHIPRIHHLIQRLLGWNILITSYSSLDDLENFEFIRLDKLSIDSAIEMFSAIYQHSNHQVVRRVIELVGIHTLTIEIIAKTCKYWGKEYPLEEILAKLQASGLSELDDFTAEVFTNHSEDSIEGLIPYYDIIFNLNALDLYNEISILLNLSILLSTPIPTQFIKESVGVSNDRKQKREFLDSVKKLESMGFILADEFTITMHEIIQYYVRYKLNPDPDKCFTLISLLNEIIKNFTFYSPKDNLNILPHCENLIKLMQSYSNNILAYIQLSLSHAFQVLSLYNKAFEYIVNFEDKFKSVIKYDQVLAKDVYLLYSSIYIHDQTILSFDKCIKRLRKARDISYKIFGKKSDELAVCYGQMGYLYLIKGDYNFSKQYFEKAYTIHLHIFGRIHKDIGLYHNNIGDIYARSNQHESAIFQYRNAIEVFNLLPNSDDSNINILKANTYVNLSKSFIERNKDRDMDNAKINLNLAYNIYENLFGNVHSSIAEVKRIEALIAEKSNDFITYIKKQEEYANIIVSLYGLNHKLAIEAQKKIKLSHFNPNALKQFLKLDFDNLDNVDWYYNQIGYMYFSGFYHLNSFDNLDITLKMVNEGKMSDKLFAAMSRSSLLKANEYFIKSNNDEMRNVIRTIFENNRWLNH